MTPILTADPVVLVRAGTIDVEKYLAMCPGRALYCLPYDVQYEVIQGREWYEPIADEM